MPNPNLIPGSPYAKVFSRLGNASRKIDTLGGVRGFNMAARPVGKGALSLLRFLKVL